VVLPCVTPGRCGHSSVCVEHVPPRSGLVKSTSTEPALAAPADQVIFACVGSGIVIVVKVALTPNAGLLHPTVSSSAQLEVTRRSSRGFPLGLIVTIAVPGRLQIFTGVEHVDFVIPDTTRTSRLGVVRCAKGAVT